MIPLRIFSRRASMALMRSHRIPMLTSVVDHAADDLHLPVQIIHPVAGQDVYQHKLFRVRWQITHFAEAI